MPKCEIPECEHEAVKPTSTAFERIRDLPGVFVYNPYLGGQRYNPTQRTAKYFCSRQCLARYLREKGF